MILLDIIIDPKDTFYRHHFHFRDTIAVPKDTTDTVTTTANVIGDNQQIADIVPRPSGIMGMGGDDILWTIFVVLVALSLCIYFVRRYRKTNQPSS